MSHRRLDPNVAIALYEQGWTLSTSAWLWRSVPEDLHVE